MKLFKIYHWSVKRPKVMKKIHTSERDGEGAENYVRESKIENEDVPGVGLDIVDD